MTHVRIIPQPVFMSQDRNRRSICSGLRDGTCHDRSNENIDVIGNIQMTNDSAGTGYGAALADGCATRDAYASCYCRMRTNTDIVRDLYLVIEFDALFDNRILYRTTINRCVGADLDIIANPDLSGLWNLDRAKPKPSEPITAPECMMTLLPMQVA